MSQRLVTTNSSIGSHGMPIFQSSGLVPLHAAYSIPAGKGSRFISSAAASGTLPLMQGMEAYGAKLHRMDEPSNSTPAGSATLGGSSALAQLLKMDASQLGSIRPALNRDRLLNLENKVEDASAGNLNKPFENSLIGKIGLATSYPSIDVHSVSSHTSLASSERNASSPAKAFKPLAKPFGADRVEAVKSASNRVSVQEDLRLNTVDHVSVPDKQTGKLKRNAGSIVTALRKVNDSEATKLDPDTKEWHTNKMEQEDESEELVAMDNNPFNMRIVNLNNFPMAQSVYRANYRSHSVACVRAKLGSIQNTAKSLDLLRQILQKSLNAEIEAILRKYVEDYFQPALENIRLNNGENAASVEHVNNVCRQILEEAKKTFSSDNRSSTPDIPDNASDSGSTDDARNGRPIRVSGHIRKRKLSSGSESSSCAPKMKKKGRFGPHLQPSSGRSTPSKKLEPIRREGPLWDPERMKSDTLFVMGARANKALGLGATRGRLYIKHPEVFKYTADQDDKQWLYEKHLMPATGGKTYLLLVDDIKELAQSDEYRNNPGLLLDELVGFTVPESMLEKMRSQMNAMRTDTYKVSHLIREARATESLPRPSPANSETHEVLTEQEYEDYSAAASPLNETGGFSQEPSPAPSQGPSETNNGEDSDEDAPLTASFYVT